MYLYSHGAPRWNLCVPLCALSAIRDLSVAEISALILGSYYRLTGHDLGEVDCTCFPLHARSFTGISHSHVMHWANWEFMLTSSSKVKKTEMSQCGLVKKIQSKE